DPAVDFGATLSVYRHGRGDPTTRLSTHDFWRATYTPDGPGTLRISWAGGEIESDAWGPGTSWLLARVGHMLGGCDRGVEFSSDDHPAVRKAARNHPGLRIGASSMLYHELLPTVLAQRVTGVEALRQWRQVCARLGEPAPGPDATLLLPPAPERILA